MGELLAHTAFRLSRVDEDETPLKDLADKIGLAHASPSVDGHKLRLFRVI